MREPAKCKCGSTDFKVYLSDSTIDPCTYYFCSDCAMFYNEHSLSYASTKEDSE
jgi:hypothetical protein